MNKLCVGTLVESKTDYQLLRKMQAKSAQRLRAGLESSMEAAPKFLYLSMAYDRGSEMA